MPNVTLASSTFNADVYAAITNYATALRAPVRVVPIGPNLVGDAVPAVNGYVTNIYREVSAGVLAVQRAWKLDWEMVPEATRAAVEAIALLGTSFTAVLPFGTYTVQCRPDQQIEQFPQETVRGVGIYWRVSLSIYKVGV